MNIYNVKVAFQAVETVRVWSNSLTEAKDDAVHELVLKSGLDIISGSYEILEVAQE